MSAQRAMCPTCPSLIVVKLTAYHHLLLWQLSCQMLTLGWHYYYREALF
jgi:hypothetical protein